MNQHLAHFFAAFKFSLAGLVTAFKREIAFRQEVFILCLIIPVSFMLKVSWLERSLILGSWLLVMAIELINSSIERLTDRISTERHPLAGQAKDMASAAVLIGILISVLVWLGALL